MSHDVEVRKIVLLPRFTTFSGQQAFIGAPISVREFASAEIGLWVGNAIGTSPGFTMVVQESPDLEIWNVLSTFTPTPGTELVKSMDFIREWIRITVTLAGTDPAFTGWSVGNFVTRARPA